MIYMSGLLGSAWLGSKVLFLASSIGIDQSELMLKPSFWFGGGLVFYGGLIGGVGFSWVYFKLNKISFSKISFLAIILSFTHALGRIGCFLAGCCFGIESSVIFSVHIHGRERMPVQLFESILLVLLGFYLLKLWKQKKYNLIFYIYFVSYSIIRFFLEFLRADQIRGEFYGLSTSQWISLLILALILSFSIKNRDSIKV